MSQNKSATAMTVALNKKYLSVNQNLISSDVHAISNSFSGYAGVCSTFNFEGDAC